MAKKPPLDFEDAIFDSFAKKKDLDYVELPLSRQAFVLVAFAAVLLSAAIVSRVVFFNLIRGDFYALRADANVHKEIVVPAKRGVIVDRYDRVIVQNTPSFTVYLDAAEVIKRDLLAVTLQNLAGFLDLDAQEIQSALKNVDLEKNNLIAVAHGVTPEQLIKLKSLNLSGVTVEDDFRREYLDGSAFAHIVGYSGTVKAGLEAVYDEHLSGQDGQLIVFRDALGKEIDKKSVSEPITGNKLVTTLDAELQRYFYNRLKDGLRSLGRDSGVGLAINPQTGEVLAMVSLPSFDNNLFTRSGSNKEKNSLLSSPSKPLFNRAISGIYTPGSVIKPLVALAALRENIVTPDFRVFSSGSIEIPNPYNPEKPSRFLDWKAHGWVDLHSALARSSNVYFYTIGGGFENTKGLGIEKLREYWQKFLLGQKTGIDLPSENSGFLPSTEEKEQRTGDIWRIGDTYNVSIGQGDLLLTPLQLINFIASIGNGGKIYRLRLVTNYQLPITNYQLLDYSDWQSEIKEVQRGLEDAVEMLYGTANLLGYLPMKAAGKTGSAQVANNTRTNAFFAGYAPVENPQIAVLVLVENSREGSLNAVPIAKDVLEWYYYNRLSK